MEGDGARKERIKKRDENYNDERRREGRKSYRSYAV